jgi:hypothetical protein
MFGPLLLESFQMAIIRAAASASTSENWKDARLQQSDLQSLKRRLP